MALYFDIVDATMQLKNAHALVCLDAPDRIVYKKQVKRKPQFNVGK